MNITWESLDERDQVALARQALDRAVRIVTARAEQLADELERGSIADHGGVDALRLFAGLTRCTPTITPEAIHSQISHGQVGHA